MISLRTDDPNGRRDVGGEPWTSRFYVREEVPLTHELLAAMQACDEAGRHWNRAGQACVDMMSCSDLAQTSELARYGYSCTDVDGESKCFFLMGERPEFWDGERTCQEAHGSLARFGSAQEDEFATNQVCQGACLLGYYPNDPDRQLINGYNGMRGGYGERWNRQDSSYCIGIDQGQPVSWYDDKNCGPNDMRGLCKLTGCVGSE